MPKHLRGETRLFVRGRETRLALGCSLQRWATVSRFGSTQSAIGRQFNLVLPNFRHLTISKPIGNRRRLNADRSSDLGLAAKVFKKVIRGHATSISHALRNVQEKYRHNLSNARYDSIMDKTWHFRLNEALEVRKHDWQDLFNYLASVKKITKPSVYAWKPEYGKQSHMMDGDNAAYVCSWLRINPMWLFHNTGPSGLEEAGTAKRIAKLVSDMTEEERKTLEVYLMIDAQRKKASESLAVQHQSTDLDSDRAAQ